MKFLGPPSSGSARGDTFSRNRFGQYCRNRSSPVQPRTPAQLLQRARMVTSAAGWRALTDVQRAGWESLGAMISRTDSLGQVYTLTGFMAYCSVNNNLQDAGGSPVATAPVLNTPPDLLTATITLTAAALSVAYTATPLGAGVRLFVFASPQRSAGRSFEGDYRLISVSGAAAASPFNVFTPYQAKFGTPVVGNRVFFKLQTYRDGFLGSPLGVSQVVA